MPLDDQFHEIYDHLGIDSAEWSDPSIPHFSDRTPTRQPYMYTLEPGKLTRSYVSLLSSTKLPDSDTSVMDPTLSLYSSSAVYSHDELDELDMYSAHPLDSGISPMQVLRPIIASPTASEANALSDDLFPIKHGQSASQTKPCSSRSSERHSASLTHHNIISTGRNLESFAPADHCMRSVDLGSTSPVTASMTLGPVAGRGTESVDKLLSITVRRLAQRKEANPN